MTLIQSLAWTAVAAIGSSAGVATVLDVLPPVHEACLWVAVASMAMSTGVAGYVGRLRRELGELRAPKP